jgi:hypothetical protein
MKTIRDELDLFMAGQDQEARTRLMNRYNAAHGTEYREWTSSVEYLIREWLNG